MKDVSHACDECGEPMALRTHQHTERVGQNSVVDATGMAWHCDRCNEVDLKLDQLAGYQRRAAAIVLREAKTVDGLVLKYARKAVGMKQTELAELLGCRPETLSRYETDEAVMPRAERLAIVAILDGVESAGGIAEYLNQETQKTSLMFEVPPLRRACG